MPSKKKSSVQTKSPRKGRKIKKWLRGVVFCYESKEFGEVFGIVVVSEQRLCCSETKEDGSLSSSVNMIVTLPQCVIFAKSNTQGQPPVFALSESIPEVAFQITKAAQRNPMNSIVMAHIEAIKLVLNTFDLVSKTR